MNWLTLLRGNLRFHHRGNLAVILGIAVATAAIVGALLVGDSLRGSLRERVEQRLGSITHVMQVSSVFWSADDLQRLGLLPVWIASGSAETRSKDGQMHRATDVILIEASNPWDLPNFILNVKPGLPSSRCPPEAISPALANELGLLPGQTVEFRYQRQHPSILARESLFGRKTGADLLDATAIEPEVPAAENPLATFGLDAGARAPRVLFKSQKDWRDASYFHPNAVLANGTVPTNDALRKVLKLGDFQLRVWLKPDTPKKIAENPTHIALQSGQLLLSRATVAIALDAARDLNLRAEPALVYLANSISDGTHEIRYSVVAALNPQADAPLGPFLDPKEPPLADDEILLADWSDSPLTAKPGDMITLKYFLPESEGKATEATATFKLRARVPMTGVAADPSLTPEFPGITDKLTLGEWDPPFPYDPKRIQKRDEDYWHKYRGTPKAYVNLAVGQKLFGSRFGVATSVRIAPKSPQTIEADAKAFEAALKQHLNPADFGFVFRNVREEALKAAEGSVNFSGLFLGFSFFLIAAALLLVALLVRLNLDRRASEIGTWFALGFTVRQVRRLLLVEGIWLAVISAAIGLILAVGYTALMLRLIAAMWPEGEIDSFLGLHVRTVSLVYGFFAAIFASVLTIVFALRSLRRVPTTALLHGVSNYQPEAQAMDSGFYPRLRFGLVTILAICCLAAGVFVHQPEARAGAFFGAGTLFLTAGLMLLRRRLLSTESTSQPNRSLFQLGARNAARNPTRSMLTAGLIASAAFMLVAVESFRRTPEANFADKYGGSGGYQFIASLDVPLYQDPEDPDTGRQEILDALERAGKLQGAEELLKASRLIPIRVKAGDDAGCRNLNKPLAPRLLGVPNRFVERGGIHFASTTESKTNPWELLPTPKDEIPIFGEANTVKWMLGKSLGDIIEITDGRGQPAKLRIVGLLQDSIFQGELVMAEKRLLELYPSMEGYSILLAEAPHGREEELRALLETAYADRGISIERSADRLKSYLAVENTYLSTFQILGGFGLLLGACGLGVVLMRSAWERRGELALLQAVGFRRRDLGWLVFSETLCLLGFGVGIGVGAALFAVLPQRFVGESATIPVVRLVIMLGGVVLVGIAAGMLALRPTLRAPIVAALRGD